MSGETITDDTLARAAAKPKPLLKLDAARLRRLIADIEANSAPHLRDALVARLVAEEGLVIDERNAAVTTHFAMAGVRTSCTAGVHAGLTNWCNAARRKILAGEAV